jgi:hypothetical protein
MADLDGETQNKRRRQGLLLNLQNDWCRKQDSNL